MFNPKYVVSGDMVQLLLRIEAVRGQIIHLPLTVSVLASLRESARLYTTHYSTMIEGNRLDSEQVAQVIQLQGHFPGKERDEQEVRGYYVALDFVERCVAEQKILSEEMVQQLHGLVVAGGSVRITPTIYRDGQNVIRDSVSRRIIYLPPEAQDVSHLMSDLVAWVSNRSDIACPIVAAIVHYQFATIHPYFDGNGRTARLLTTFVLHRGGYDLKGIYSLEEYYARDLMAYYEAISAGDSHNYYLGRAEADITLWIEYFLRGMAESFEHVLAQMLKVVKSETKDVAGILRMLDARQRKVLELFRKSHVITSRQVAELFGCSERTAASLCVSWVEKEFFVIADPSNRARKYGLAESYQQLID